MSPDIQINNDVAIAIHGFETQYREAFREGPDGLPERYLQAFDVVTYSPLGDKKTVIIREVRKIMQVRSLEDCGDNIASLIAYKICERIKPAYEHWKENNALPETGTPLGAWPGVTKAQADILRGAGLRSVEDVAGATDIVMGKTGLANAIGIRDLARKYLATASTTNEAAKMAKLEADNAELKEQISELMKLMQEMTRPEAEEPSAPPAGKKSAKAAA